MIKVPYYLMRVEGHLQVNGPNTWISAIFNSWYDGVWNSYSGILSHEQDDHSFLH